MKVALIVGLVIGLVLFGALVITLVWAWVVPDVFSGAVERGILPASVTFVQALKLMVLLSILGFTGRAGSK